MNREQTSRNDNTANAVLPAPVVARVEGHLWSAHRTRMAGVRCVQCRVDFPRFSPAVYDADARTVQCAICAPSSVVAALVAKGAVLS